MDGRQDEMFVKRNLFYFGHTSSEMSMSYIKIGVKNT